MLLIFPVSMLIRIQMNGPNAVSMLDEEEEGGGGLS